MLHTDILPPLVFAFVPRTGAVVSNRTAPSFPSSENALVVNIAAARMLTAVHSNIRFLGIASSLFLSSRFTQPAGIIILFEEGCNRRFKSSRCFWGCEAGGGLGAALFDMAG